MEDIKKEYSRLQAKYRLPEFESLDRDFEISLIEHQRMLLLNIRKKIAEKIEDFSHMLEDILHPNTDLRSMYEDRFFSEPEKAGMFELYKRLMALSREALGLGIEADEKDDAEFIKKITVEWKGIKEELHKITGKLKESWKKEIESESRLEYFG